MPGCPGDSARRSNDSARPISSSARSSGPEDLHGGAGGGVPAAARRRARRALRRRSPGAGGGPRPAPRRAVLDLRAQAFGRRLHRTGALGDAYHRRAGGRQVQRPQIASLVRRDLAAISWIAPILVGRIPVTALANPPALVEVFAETIVEELDCRLEADSMLDIAAIFAETEQRSIVDVVPGEAIEGASPCSTTASPAGSTARGAAPLCDWSSAPPSTTYGCSSTPSRPWGATARC